MSKPHDLEYLNDAARAVTALLPDHHGFIIMAVPHQGGDHRLKYISDLSREKTVEAVKDFLNGSCCEEKWGKHLP